MPIKQNQRGFAPVVLIVVAAVVAIGAVVLLSKGSGGLSLPTTTSLQRATEKDFEFVTDPNLKKHFVAQANQTSYRAKSYSDAADLTFVTEIQIKGENFNTRDQELDPTGKETKHKVEIGETIYVKDSSDNKWWKQTIKPEELPKEEKENEPTDFKEEYSEPDLKFKFIGKEACGTSASGLTCFKYEQLSGGPQDLAFSRIFWFDDKKYLLRRDEVVSGEFKTTVEYSYDGINIVPPSPTKDVPQGKSVFDYYYNVAASAPPPANVQYDQMQAPSLENMNMEDMGNTEDFSPQLDY